jgi:uncharacterized protein (DUF433 family)
MRLSEETDRFVTDEARRTRRSKGAVVESLAEEAARCRRFPGIAFRGADAERRPWIVGSGYDVWQVIEALDDFESIGRLAEETSLTEPQIRLALAYKESYPDEISEAIAANNRPVEEYMRGLPFAEASYVE